MYVPIGCFQHTTCSDLATVALQQHDLFKGSPGQRSIQCRNLQPLPAVCPILALEVIDN